jgi:hypothetical protein
LLGPLAVVAGDETVELRLPLEQGRYISLRGLYSECNRVLGTRFDLESVGDQRVEMTLPRRMALRAVDLRYAEKSLVTLEREALVLRIPKRDDPQERRRIRRLLGKALGIELEEFPANYGLHLPSF